VQPYSVLCLDLPIWFSANMANARIGVVNFYTGQAAHGALLVLATLLCQSVFVRGASEYET